MTLLYNIFISLFEITVYPLNDLFLHLEFYVSTKTNKFNENSSDVFFGLFHLYSYCMSKNLVNFHTILTISQDLSDI